MKTRFQKRFLQGKSFFSLSCSPERLRYYSEFLFLPAANPYLSDTTLRTFKSWLKKQPSSPWRDRFLSDRLVPARGTRSHYEAHVRLLHCSEEEHEDFVRLWKLMLFERA